MTIELAKFKGYESKLDIYSFKTEFEKLVQPRVQNTFWLHVLRKKYLAGHALVLVEKLETIQEAWTTLISAYGNVKLLLQNKISNLDKLECLDKVKGDEKIGIAIAKITNMMIELGDLAQKHNLEYKLYVGGGLEKIYSLIGSERERKFLSKSVTNPTSSGTSDVLDEKLEWNNLLEFLKKELTMREKMTLLQKSKHCLGVKTERNPRDGRTTGFGGSANVPPLNNDLKCHICDRTGHVVSVDRAGRKFIDYVSCKTFVDMSCVERRDILRSKGFCLQCLSPGVKYDQTHTCYTKYKCPDTCFDLLCS